MKEMMKTSMIVICMFVVAGCSNNRTVTLFSADFSEIEDTSFQSFSPPGPPSGDGLEVANSIGEEPGTVNISGGELRISSDAEAFQELRFNPASRPADTSSITYVWRGTFDEIQLADPQRASIFGIKLEVPRARRGPLRILTLDMRIETVDGSRVLRVFNRGDQIGTLGVGRSHGVILSVDLNDNTFMVSGGNFGDITSGSLDLSASVPPNNVPRAVVNIGAGFNNLAEYGFETFDIFATGPRP